MSADARAAAGRIGGKLGGKLAGKKYRRLLVKERTKKLSADEKAKLTKWRAGKEASGRTGAANTIKEFDRLLKLEEAKNLSAENNVKLSNMRAGRFDGVSEGQSAEWNRMYQKLRAYKEKNGDCIVPVINGKVSELSHWVANQRAQKKLKIEGKPSLLTGERQAKLDEISFTWKVNLSWNDRYRQLQSVGSCSGSAIRDSDASLSLYSWCSHQVESQQLWKRNEREYQRQLSSWKGRGHRGDKPTRKKTHETWIKREELLDQLGFWDQFKNC